MIDKIVTIEDLGEISSNLRKQGKKIIHCHGVFDLLHPGHLRHFQAAKKLGDILIVTLTEDKYVNKGPGRPIFNELIRAESIAALEIVNFVAINRNPLATSAIEIIKPDFYVKGQDYKNEAEDLTQGIMYERDRVEQFGGKMVFTEEIQFSSTALINRNVDFTTDELKGFLQNIREKTSFEKLKRDFDAISRMNVFIIGEIILDEYTFVDPLGKASKSATITAKKLNSELYAGGVLAVANHISNFVNKVKIVTFYGENFGKNYLNFIKNKLNQNIELVAIYSKDRPTVLKQRFVDKIFKHKLFELIEINDLPLASEIKDALINEIKTIKNNFDLVVASDFGHGLVDLEIIDILQKSNLFLAINAQTNSANKGFNLVTKYSKCDYFSIDENECRLALHDKFSDIQFLLSQLILKNEAKLGSITLGTNGSLVASAKSGFAVKAPVFSQEIVDTIGAGDAYLAISSLMAKNENSPHEIAFVGNAVGAMAVKILGNKSYIEKIPLLKYLKTLIT